MRKLFVFSILIIAASAEAIGPRSWGKSGSAAVANATVTVGGSSPFYPSSICIENTDATDNIFIDWTDGVAATTDNSTNLKIRPGKNICFQLANPNINNQMDIGIIASANTPGYNIIAIGIR